jgi:hypothetical protein
MSALVQLTVEGMQLDRHEHTAEPSTAMQRIARLTRLETLDLGRHPLSGCSVEAFMLHVTELTALQHLALTHDIDGSWTQQLSAACAALSSLTCLIVSTGSCVVSVDVDPVASGFTPALARLTRLIRLELSQVVDSDASASALAAAIARPTQLQHLKLTWNSWGERGAGIAGAQAMQGALGSLEQLTLLNLSAAFDMFEDNSASLAGHRGSAPLPAAPLGLRALELSGIGWPQDRENSLAAALAELTALTYLGMPALCASEEASLVVPIQAVRSMTAMPNLRHLYTYAHDTCLDCMNRMGEALASITQITRLEFQPMVNGRNVACLAPHIAKLTGLQLLSLWIACEVYGIVSADTAACKVAAQGQC